MYNDLKEIPDPQTPNDRTSWENFKRINQANNGIYYTSRWPALSALLTAIGSNDATVYVNSTVTLTADTTIPANVSVVDSSGLFSGAYTLTINGPFRWGDRRAVSDTVTLIFGDSSTRVFNALWHGVSIDSADNVDEFQASIACACASTATSPGKWYLPDGTFDCSDVLSVTSRRLDIEMVGKINALDFNDACIDVDPGPDGSDWERINDRKYTFNVERNTLSWTNGANRKYDGGSWVVNNCGVRLTNVNKSEITIRNAQQFDVGVDIVCKGGSFTFNKFEAYSCRRNQIGIRVRTLTHNSAPGFFNDNTWIGGDFRVDGGNSSLNNKSRYWLVIDDAQDFDNNIFLKVGCELNTINYTISANEEGPCIFMSGFCFGNEFLHIRGESADGFARIERGTQSGEKYPAYNKFTAGAGFEEAYTGIEDNTPTQLNFVQNYRSAGEIASRFNVPLLLPESLYDKALTFVLNASLGTNDAGVQDYFIGTASSTPTYPAGAGHHEHATGVKADSTTRSIILQPDRAIGKTIDGLFGDEEFIVMVKCAPSGECRVCFRPYDSSGSLITTVGALIGEPFRLIEYASGVLAWRHGSDENDPTIRVKLNSASIVAMDVLVFGSASNGYIQSFSVLGTQRQGSRHHSRPPHTWRVTDDLKAYRNILFQTDSGLVRQGTGTALSSIAYHIPDTHSGLTGTDQTGMHVSPTFSSTAVTTGRAIRGQARTAAATYTMATAVAVGAIDADKGSGSTITDNIAFEAPNMTAGVNNYAWKSGQGRAQYGDKVMFSKSADVASANDITIGRGNSAVITGTTTINRIATAEWQAGAEISLVLPASIVVAHNVAAGGGYAGLLLSGLANWTVGANGGSIRLLYDGSIWRQIGARVDY